MSWRTVVVSTHAKLDLHAGFMVVRTGEDTQRVILEEIALLIIENTAVSITAYLLAELVKRKTRVIFCDQTRNPLAELHPYHGCHDVTRKLRVQLSWSSESKLNIWKAIIREKIKNQKNLLARHNRLEAVKLLSAYENDLAPGDPANREGHAAKVYFAGLFGDDFRRSKTCDINAALDYGYMMLLAVFNRALAAEGMLTQMGIAHGNVYNQWNLSCDLIEPFRPLIDACVLQLVQNRDFCFNTPTKRTLVHILHNACIISGKTQAVLNAIVLYVRSVLHALEQGDSALITFPQL